MMRRSPLIAAVILLCASGIAHAQAPPSPPLTPAVRRAVLDSVRQALVTYYVFPDTAKLMAAALEQRRKDAAFDTLTRADALAAAITRELLRVHRDAHLRIEYDPAEAARAADTTRRERRDQSARDLKVNFYFRDARILPGNIGYLEFYQFADTSAAARKTVRAAMQLVAHADALILDLRDNRGGSAAMGGEIAGYFVPDSAHWSDSYNRLTDKWTESWVVNRPEVTGGIHLGMPVTVLTSQWTFSAAEGLAYALQQGRKARVVGQPTAGGAHVLRRVGLGNGFVGFVPYIRPVNVMTKSNWEGTGVIPDVTADAPSALLRAQEAILGERMASAKDSTDMRAIAWTLNDARAAAAADVAPAVLLDFAGRFEEYTFSVRGNSLYSENRSRNGRLDRLRPVTPTLFAIDLESQVEFLRDATGIVSSIRILWNDGWIDTIARTR